MDTLNAIVIDHGSYKCRAGFASEESPRSQFLSLTGRPKTDTSEYITDLEYKGVYIGDRLLPLVDRLQLRYPIEHGHVTNWDDVEEIWKFVFCEQLGVEPEEHPVLISESTRNPKISREKVTSIMFEAFNVPAFYLAQQEVLSLFATGRTEGIVLNSGYSVTHTVPVYEGHNLIMGNRKLDFGGGFVTDLLRKRLKEKGIEFKSRSQFMTLQDITEKRCYTALDFEKELQDATELKTNECYQLPDGTNISLGSERFQCVELLFHPLKFGFECYGVHELIYDSIVKLDPDIHKDMFSNILIAGGTTMYPKFDERLQKEMKSLNQSSKVIAPPERHLSAWKGGAAVASLSDFLNTCISKAEYDEYGPCIVHRKCF